MLTFYKELQLLKQESGKKVTKAGISIVQRDAQPSKQFSPNDLIDDERSSVSRA
jgi:hypothetical protein